MRASNGITLIELLVAMAVLAVVAALGAPAMQGFVRTSQLRGATNEVAYLLAYARSEAIKRGHPVTVCKALDVAAEAPECTTNAANSWQGGWMAFVDFNEDGIPNTQGTRSDVRLRVGQVNYAGLQIDPGTNFRDFVRYLPMGGSQGSGGQAGGLFTICNHGKGRRIDIGNTGHTTVKELATC